MKDFQPMMASRYSKGLADLREMLVSRSITFGQFKLASGRTTDTYVDAKLTTCSAAAIPLIGQAFLSVIRERGWFPEAVGGLTMGADPIALAVASQSLQGWDRPIDAFIVRKEPKKHGLGKYIEGLARTEGLKVVILDDVCTTGGSTAIAIEKALDEKMRVLGAVCLVDREEGATELIGDKFHCALASVFRLRELRSYADGFRATAESVETAL